MPKLKSWFTILLISAVIGNICSISLFFGIDFLLGSIAIFVILQRYGLVLGIVATLVASVYTYILWGHPYAIIFLVCETIWVGLFIRKTHGYNLVLYDVLYWILLGMPLIWVSFIFIMQMNSQIALLIALKWTINGVFNALCATLLIAYTSIGSEHKRYSLSFQRTIYNVLATFVLSVALGIMVFNTYLGLQHVETEIVNSLKTKSVEVQHMVKFWSENNIEQALISVLLQGSKQTKITILDSSNKVLITNDKNNVISKILERYNNGDFQPINSEISLWTPAKFNNKSKIARWKNSFYVYQHQIDDISGWQLVIETPLAPYQKYLYDLYIKNLSILLIIILIIVWLSNKISKQMVVSLEEVSAITVKLSAQSEPTRIAWPHSKLKEVNILIDNFKQMSQKIAERTRELGTANQEILILNDKLKAENLRMGTELEITRRIQQMVLPSEQELKNINHLDIAGFMESTDEVAGDYYEVLNHDGHIKIGIGDVVGHGLESGVLMLMVQTTVRALLLAGIDHPEKFLDIVNRTIYHNVKRMKTDKNLTLSLLDYKNGKLKLTGQHEYVLLIRKNGEIEQIDTFDLGFSIGLVDDIAEFVSHIEISLEFGDGIALYTDGITEAWNVHDEQYGIDRLCDVISSNWSQTAKQIQQAVIADVKEYIGTRKVVDDITLLILKQK